MRRLSMLLVPIFLIITLFSATPLFNGTARAAPIAKSPPSRHQPKVMKVNQRLPKVKSNKPLTTVQGGGDLIWHNGPVEENPRVFLIFWGPAWNNGSGGLTADGQIVENYFNDLVGAATAFENILPQYYDANAHIPNTLTVGGTYSDFSTPPTDTTCNSSPTIEDSSIQTEVQNAITANGWPTDPANSSYLVFTANNFYVNAGSCSELQICAYHGDTISSSLPYAAIPYPFGTGCQTPAAPNGNIFGDSIANLVSHEEMEAITDPQLDAWFDNLNFEIGDKCAFDFSAGLTHLNNGGVFELQTEYSNHAHDCVGGYSLTPSDIQVTPSTVSLVTTPGTSPAAQSLVLNNFGTGPLNWTAGFLPSWVQVNPTSGTVPALGGRTLLTLSFNITSATAQTYATKLFITDPNADNTPFILPITVVATNAAKTWYFAEGYTGGSFSEFLTLANPNTALANVTVTYLLGSGGPIVIPYPVLPTSRKTINVNKEIGPNQNVSMVVTSDQPIIAERPMYFTFTGLPGFSIPGGSDVLGATSLSTNFDFGYLDNTFGHDTFLTILNQNNVTMNVTIQYFGATVGGPITRTHAVNPNSRGTVIVNQENLPADTYSALVTLDQPGLVERPLYLQDAFTGYTGSADVVGVPTPQENWYFAEGFSASTFSERYILSNPSTTNTVTATIVFLLSSGSPVSNTQTLAPGKQVIVFASSVLGTNNVNNSAVIHASGPILAERFISFKYTGAVGGSSSSSIPGTSDVLGATAPGFLFDFAEGYTGSTFAEYLTIENPSGSNTALVTVTFLPANGAAPIPKTYFIAPSSRFTLFTNSVLNNQSFSMVVSSNIAIVAERPMYFTFTGHQTGGSDVVGFQSSGTQLPASALSLYAGSSDGNEYALDAGVGAFRWKYQTNGGLVSRAAESNGILYVGSFDDNLYALKTSDGSQAWAPFTTGGPVESSPAVSNGIVYFGSFDGKVYALNASTGTPAWSSPFLTGGSIESSPTVVNGVVYIGSDDGFLYALNASTGALIWQVTESTAPLVAAPTVANGVVYIGSADGNEYALNTTNGALIWHFQTGAAVIWASVVSNGVVYFGSEDHVEYAISASNGAFIWGDLTNGGIDSSPTIDSVAGVLYFGSADRFLYAVNTSNGSLIWEFQTGGAVEASPVVVNGVVYVGSTDDSFYALNAMNGSLYWSFTTGGPVFTDMFVGP